MCALEGKGIREGNLANKDYYIAAALVILSFMLSYLRLVEGVCGVYHDDGIYLSTAKSIADGTGYRLINIPYSPFQTKYPFLYPAILAIVWKFYPSFPDNLFIMQIGSAAFGAFSIGLAYLYLVDLDYGSRWITFLSAILTTSSPVFLFYSTLTLSEMPFLFFIVIALWILERQRRANYGSLHQLTSGIALSLPFLCRTVGIVIPMIALLVLRRQFVEKKWVFFGMGVGGSVWPIWSLLNASNEPDLVQYYTSYLEFWQNFGSNMPLTIFIQNFISFIFSLLNLNSPEISSIVTKNILLIFFVFGILIVIRIIYDSIKNKVLAIFLVFYLLFILVWPWPVYRFVVPILVFINFYMINFLSSRKSNKYHTLYLIPFILVFLINIYNYPSYLGVGKKFNYPSNNPTGSGAAWNDYVELFEWIKINTEKSDIISSGMDTMIFLYTERQGIRPFLSNPIGLFYSKCDEPLGNIKQLHENLIRTKAKYIIQTPMPNFSEEKPFNSLMDKIIEFHPAFLKRVYVGNDPRFIIYEIDQSYVL
jgi:hypothetical protein